MGVETGRGFGACRGARGCVQLQLGCGDKQAHAVGELARIGRVALCQGLALGLVAVEQILGGALVQRVGKLPAQVDGILHRSVVAQATRGCEEVGCVTTDINPALSEALGHQGVACGPGQHGQDLDGNLAA